MDFELSAVMTADEFESVPEPFQALYEQRDGKYEMTRVSGIKTEADVTRLQEALRKERDDRKAATSRLASFGDADPERYRSMEEEISDLKGRLEEAGVSHQELESKIKDRLEAKYQSKIAELQGHMANGMRFVHETAAKDRRRTIIDAVRGLPGDDMKFNEGALRDVERFARDECTVDDDGRVVMKGSDDFEEGLPLKDAVAQMRDNGLSPHWFVQSRGGGARGGSNKGAGEWAGKNPFESGGSLEDRTRLISENPSLALRKAKEAKASGRVIADIEARINAR